MANQKTAQIPSLQTLWRNHALAIEITLVLAIKLVVIMVIKAHFFSSPIERSDAHQRVEQMWLTPSHPTQSSDQPGSTHNG